MTPLMQIISVLIWIFLLKFIQMSVWPALKAAFGKFSYGISYPVSVLLFALFSWYCGLLGLPLYFSVLIFAAVFAFFAYRREYTRDTISSNLGWDVVFFLLFFFMLEVRYLNPSISYAEKFMDHAFLSSVINNPLVPPVDPWYSGGALNVYYYMGHWIFGALGFVTGIKSTVVFNLILPTVFANAGISLYAAGKLLLKKYCWLPLLTLFAINPSFVYHALAGEGISAIMWESTRTISGAITEYPLFSMLWGDPHAHVISLFNQALFIFLLIYTYMRWGDLGDKGRRAVACILALSLGTMPLVNTWDVLIYAPALLILGIILFLKDRDEGLIKALPVQILIFVPALSVLIYLPYYLMLSTGGIEGIGLVHTPTGIFAFILVYGFFLVIAYAECIKDLIKRPYLIIAAVPFILLGYAGAGLCIVPALALALRKERLPEDLLAAFGFFVIILTETIYLVDNMGDAYFRMNTVFKFSIIAWMMLGISSSVFIGRYLYRRNPKPADEVKKKRLNALAAVIIAALFIIPVVLPDLNYGYGGKTLDGMDWMKTQHPDDYGAIEYLRGLEGEPGVVEAEGGDYKYYSRISSMTGYPAIIGMPFHEQMWRGDGALVGERMSDVRKIYENPDECISLMEKYGMTYIVVGKPETDIYDVKLPLSLLDVVYKNNGTIVYALK